MSVESLGFTYENYRQCIRRTNELYSCVGFEILDQSKLPEDVAIIRHDIDMSPRNAVSLAKIEAELGVRATYTVLITGEFYSPFEVDTRNQLFEIVSLGHDIGLHFDAAWHEVTSENKLEDAILWEMNILNELLGLKGDRRVKMFSFHNTTPFTMSCKGRVYGTLKNAYAGVLQENVEYTSDSNGYWIHRTWDDILEERHSRIQVLTHPEWWSEKRSEPGEKVCGTLADRTNFVWNNYCQILQDGHRINKTSIPQTLKILPDIIGREGQDLVTLWLQGLRNEAYLSLYLHFSKEVFRLLKMLFTGRFGISAPQVEGLIHNRTLNLDALVVLAVVADCDLVEITGGYIRGLDCLNLKLQQLSFDDEMKVATADSIEELSRLLYRLKEWEKKSSYFDEEYYGTVNLDPAEMLHVRPLESWLKNNQLKLGLSESAILSYVSHCKELCLASLE